mmetsp:Transcript_37863/g.69008  ORF Transcript_37863/g.69008 Transcript_37863/m.69008 type:complete len:157 (+) Transcript_37863:1381-1851(+)
MAALEAGTHREARLREPLCNGLGGPHSASEYAHNASSMPVVEIRSKTAVQKQQSRHRDAARQQQLLNDRGVLSQGFSKESASASELSWQACRGCRAHVLVWIVGSLAKPSSRPRQRFGHELLFPLSRDPVGEPAGGSLPCGRCTDGGHSTLPGACV